MFSGSMETFLSILLAASVADPDDKSISEQIKFLTPMFSFGNIVNLTIDWCQQYSSMKAALNIHQAAQVADPDRPVQIQTLLNFFNTNFLITFFW